MSSKAAKIIAAIAVLLTVILAMVGYRVSRTFAEDAQTAASVVKPESAVEQAAPKLLAVVAARPLAAYHKIDKDSVQLVEVAIAPTDYFTSVDQVIGKEPLTDIDSGAPITGRYFAQGNPLAKAIPPGFQAVSVDISDVIAVGGFVRPGDVVDVLIYLKGTQDVQEVQARVLLRSVRVLAYEDLITERPEGLKEEEKANRANENRRTRTAVLAVPLADTTRLMLGASIGDLRLALHGLKPEEQVVALNAGDPATSTSPATGAGGTPEATPAAAALPISDAALNEAARKLEADKTPPRRITPDKIITAEQLGYIEPPPGKKVVRQQVYVYRSSTMETVTP
ncbi:MAG: Flp pilus assembly protein CpaB [Panacagrimonas sp.]